MKAPEAGWQSFENIVQRGIFAADKERLVEALEYFERALDMVKRDGDALKIIGVLRNRSNILIRMARFEEAQQSLNEAYEEARKLGDPELTRQALKDLETVRAMFHEKTERRIVSQCEH